MQRRPVAPLAGDDNDEEGSELGSKKPKEPFLPKALQKLSGNTKKKVEGVIGYRVEQVEDSTNKELRLVLNSISSPEHLLRMNKRASVAYADSP
ncbi:hypothetical protein V7S43_014479 [Phytophthora oleae]|uniref:Uncharacterized protein n=1 Tax=Phytophthora oleae TaxID=2107226 RepID=A0ABD3F4J3_9STRA